MTTIDARFGRVGITLNSIALSVEPTASCQPMTRRGAVRWPMKHIYECRLPTYSRLEGHRPANKIEEASSQSVSEWLAPAVLAAKSSLHHPPQRPPQTNVVALREQTQQIDAPARADDARAGEATGRHCRVCSPPGGRARAHTHRRGGRWLCSSAAEAARAIHVWLWMRT